MPTTLSLSGKKVRLEPFDPERDSVHLAGWFRNAEYMRLMDTEPARLFSPEAVKKWQEKDLEVERPNGVLFLIVRQEDDLPIGFIGLDGVDLLHGDSFIGIGIGEQELWGQGYGTEAMRLSLEYGFQVLNLHRVTLNVFDYNQRAIRSYEKCGFQVEGRQRQAIHRDGRRYDILFMGVLREDWELLSGGD